MGTIVRSTFSKLLAGRMSKHPSKAKAKEFLKDGSVRGKELTKKQRGLFGAIAGGQRVRGAGHQGSPFEFAPTPKFMARGKLNKY